ncbi:hypothetical protein GCM10009804_70850 [Kribbella hippodromi]|uniref:Amidohydrolase-related domain-containing protein n=1 Tax=Kribbella hippodromi TaxID=434347 RepID=A0ABN2EIG1_9ACTN
MVDSHVHVGRWKYREFGDYLPDMAAAGVAAAVLVQFVGNTDNRYLIDCAETDPARFAVVAMVDPAEAGAVRHVDRLARSEVVRGIRLWASSRSTGNDPLAIWKAIEANGLVASVRGPLSDLAAPAFRRIVEALPDLRIRLEHLGFAVYHELEAADHPDFEAFLQLAEYPQVATMWAGFYANSSAPYPYPIADRFLRAAVRAYGAQRITWSGDWNRPEVQPAEYAQAVDHVRDAAFLTSDQADWILGRSTVELFGLSRRVLS